MSYHPPLIPPQPPSKSQMKREMTALQNLGVRLTELTRVQLDTLALPEKLQGAVLEYQRLRAPGAQRRQRQYIGALMREIDAESIRQGLINLEQPQRKDQQRFKVVERLRDRLQAGDAVLLEQVFQNWPWLNDAEFRKLVTAARNKSDKTASRKLFRQLMELNTAAPFTDGSCPLPTLDNV